MAKCEGNAFAADGGDGGFRLWTPFSEAALRRRIVEVLVCGGGGSTLKRKAAPKQQYTDKPLPSPPPPPPLLVQSPPGPRLQASSSRRTHGSERLSELFKAEEEMRRKVEAFEGLKAVVRRLQGEGFRRRDAAEEVRRLARDDPKARETLAMLGSIPPLVGMLDSPDLDLQVSSLYALLNLAIGNDANKAAVAEAGAVKKMLNIIDSGAPPPLSEAIVANFLGLSALDSNKVLIGSSHAAIPFLLGAFQNSTPSSQVKQDSLRALFNLSISPSNAAHLVNSGLIPALLSSLGEMEISDRVLSVLSNVVSSMEGRKALSDAPDDGLPILIDVLNWADAPACQEKAAYVLMVVAHKAAYSSRAAMVEAGIVTSLLELTLLGTPLAQKRASRVLELLRVEQTKQVSEGFEGRGRGNAGASASAALYRGAEEEEEGMSEERRAVKELVQMSLRSNMRRIAKRANLPSDFEPSDHFRALTVSSTSKSLPL